MAKDQIGYEALIDKALRGVVRAALAKVEAQGLRGGHHFYLTFDTQHPGVEMPVFLRSQYPEVMTVVLQNKFWGLKTGDDAFEVSLTFRKTPASLRVPYAALTAFFDPGVHFGLQFQGRAGAANSAGQAGGAGNRSDVAPSSELPESANTPRGRVVSLDRFRKK